MDGADEEASCGRISSSGGRNGGDGRRRPRGQRKKVVGGNRDMSHDAWHDAPRGNHCRNCGKYGHRAKDRRKPRREQVNLATEDDDGPALLMAHACALTEKSTSISCPCAKEMQSTLVEQSIAALNQVCLEKPRVEAYLDVDNNYHADG